MKITASDLKIWDLTDENEINRFLDEIHINDDAEIIIDVSNCLILYKTSTFIDNLLINIHNVGKPRKLIIHTDYRFLSEETLYEYLFRDSSIFKNDKKDIQDIKNIILSKIKMNLDIEFILEMSHE